jgi:LysM repeat protein
MNNPNPFVPKGSLQELQSKRRTNLKFAVLGVLTLSVVCLTVMLIQGCKQKPPTDDTGTASADTNAVPAPDTNVPPPLDTNGAPPMPSGTNGSVPSPALPVAQTPVPATPIQPAFTPPTPATPDLSGGGEYVVVKGDSLAKIAKKNGVSLKALEAANEGVKPSKLKIGQKLVIPAGGKTPTDTSVSTGSSPTAAADTDEETYTVKSGDTLTKIAKAHHVKVKQLQAANGLSTTKIKVGEKLKIPARAEAPAAAPAPVSAPVDTTPAPPAPSVMPPAPSTPSVPTGSASTVPAQH